MTEPVWYDEEYEKRNPSGLGIKVTPEIIMETEYELGLRREDGRGPIEAGLETLNEPEKTSATKRKSGTKRRSKWDRSFRW